MVFDLSISDPLQRIQHHWSLSNQNTSPSWDRPLHAAITPLSATVHTPTSCTATWLLTISPNLCNRLGNLHGGCAATIFDTCTSISLAPIAQEGRFAYGGVSRTLNCAYLRPVSMGIKVVVTCEVVAVSGRLTHLRGSMREWDEDAKREKGEILVTCEHGKVNTDRRL